MFKAQVLRRSFSLFNRGPSARIIRKAVRDGHDTIHIQRVRLRKPLLSRSRIFGTILTIAGTYQFLRWLDQEDDEEVQEREERERKKKTKQLLRQLKRGGPGLGQGEEDGEEVEEEEGVDDEEEGEDGEDEDDDEALLFLPTGFSRAKPQYFYKGSDPEWQEFVRIAPDRKRIEQIRGKLVAMVREMAARSPGYTARLGKINTNKGGIWIEVRFPDGPPIEYERPGYEITDDLELRKSTRPVEAVHHRRLNNLLVPTATAKAFYVDTKEKAGRQWQELRKYLGWQEQEKDVKVSITILEPSAAEPGKLTKLTRKKASPDTPEGVTASPKSADPPQTDPSPSSSPAASPPPKDSTSPLSHPAYEKLGLNALPNPTALTLDLSTFRRTFRRHHQFPHAVFEAPRGTFIVSGLVEVIGEKAKMTVDVQGAYDPREGRYVTVSIKLRSVMDYKQRPKGGS
ncbi:hypothetical protein EJ04DRAFT_515500 [Polyplosphaeria fusca]|uniref:Uncharacterized protein n=1 Tax=Polyplosphaeria fusca TaxID=682080 RepID=A0A9P4UZC1_9PLEO|nr:hypothetical protein EJ04DRAFT_515500 [Polyplosphaeria fusca]